MFLKKAQKWVIPKLYQLLPKIYSTVCSHICPTVPDGIFIIMNKQQKQKMGQDLVDFMLDDLSLDEIAETFEMKVGTKFYFYEEDKENLVKDWKIKFPKWDIWIRRAYKEIWRGDINYEEIRFSGDGEDFNEWLKIKWYERYRNLDWNDD